MSLRARLRLGLGATVAIVALSIAGIVVTPSFREAHAGNAANSPPRASGGTVFYADPWAAKVAAFVQSKVPTLTNSVFRSPCMGFSVEVERAAASGTGDVATLATENGGVWDVKSGATASSFRIVRNRDGAAAAGSQANLVSNIKTAKWAIGARVFIKTVLSTSTLDVLRMTDEATSEVTFGMLGATSTSFWSIVVGSASAVSLGIAPIAGWQTVVTIADGANVTAYDVDNGQIGTPQSMSTAPTVVGHTLMFAANGTTASNTDFWVDDWAAWTEPGS